MRFLRLVPICIATVAFLSCDSTGPEQASGRLNPPSWLQGVWEGGSPTLLHLNVSSTDIVNKDGNREFVGFAESQPNESEYRLAKDRYVNVFTRRSSTRVDWYTSNGVLNTTTVMYKQ